MIQQSFSAQWGLLPDGKLHPNVTIITDEQGTILEIQTNITETPQLSGILCPGFVNAHCHLELSHLQGQIPKHTGMAEFARNIIRKRGEPSELMLTAAKKALQNQYKAGTNCIADICNYVEISEILTGNQPFVYSFVELLGLDPKSAERIFELGEEKLTHFQADRAFLTPHAPYSVSSPLMKAIGARASAQNTPLSIHLLESQDEVNLFEKRTGNFPALFAEIGLNFENKHTYPIDFLIANLPPHLRILWVHCVEMQEADLKKLTSTFTDSWFCLCPNANLYIHNRLPNVSLFTDWNKICIGTDSLAGNHSLDILSEIKTLQQNFPAYALEQWLTCATRNGATFLGLDKQLGSFQMGKRPGVLHLTSILSQEKPYLSESSMVERLV